MMYTRKHRLHLALAASIVLTQGAPAQDQADTSSQESSIRAVLRSKLLQPIRSQTGLNWDRLDFQDRPKGKLILKDIRNPKQSMDVDKVHANKIVLLISLDTKDPNRGWTMGAGQWGGQSLRNYKRLYDEYTPKGVVVIGLWGDEKGIADGNIEQEREKALTFIQEHDIPGLIALNRKISGGKKEGVHFLRSGQLTQWGDFNGTAVQQPQAICIRAADGRIVYRDWEWYIPYHTPKLILDRLLDPAFDQAVRKEFYPTPKRELPKAELRDDGLAYIDDFESYADSHTFKLQPCWGFNYESQSWMDRRGSLVHGAGRQGSKGVLIRSLPNAYNNLHQYQLSHRFAEPLTKGHIRFFIRRGTGAAKDRYHRDEKEYIRFRSLMVRFTAPDRFEPAGILMTDGDWGAETFVMNYRRGSGSVSYSQDAWHEVLVECQPGEKAVMRVDGKLIGEMTAEAISGMDFRAPDQGKTFFIDDVEVFFAGSAADTQAAHQALRPQSITPFQPFTAEEIAEIYREPRSAKLKQMAAALPKNSIPRKDTFQYTFDHPLIPEPIIVQDRIHQDQVVDVLKKHKGKIVFLTTGSSWEERKVRERSHHLNAVDFYLFAKLAKEFKPKGVVFVQLESIDWHHALSPKYYYDSGNEEALARAMMAEGRDPIYIMKCDYPGMFDERLLHWNRYWGLKQDVALPQGFNLAMIFDQEGRLVFRCKRMHDSMTYWPAKPALDRLLDPDFDAAYRQEFRNPDLTYYRNPLLPIQEVDATGLYYRDDFESYTDSYDLRLQPRWGFRYDFFTATTVPRIRTGEGRDKSTAVLLQSLYYGDQKCGNKVQAQEQRFAHSFPGILKEGHLRFFMRRGPTVKVHGQPPMFRIGATVIGPDGDPAQTLSAMGDWKNESFCLLPTDIFMNVDRNKKGSFEEAKAVKRDLDAKMAEDAWQEIRFVCQPGEKVRILIEGKEVAQLEIKAISAIRMYNEVWSSTYVDDVELFYTGDAEQIQAEHAEAMKADLAHRQAAWKKEVTQ